MTFLELVNRMFRQNGILRGDTDAISSFADTQHNASTQIAVIAAQNELTDLVADNLIPAERKTSGAITTVAGQRTYSLPSDFLRFYGHAHLYDAADNRQLYEYSGGLPQLQLDYYDYATQEGEPNWWYFEPTSGKKIGFFQVPDSPETFTFDYEGSVMISAVSDNLPFSADEESYAFAEMAGRRFKYMFEDVNNQADIVAVLMADQTYRRAKARLAALLRGRNPARAYGFVYR